MKKSKKLKIKEPFKMQFTLTYDPLKAQLPADDSLFGKRWRSYVSVLNNHDLTTAADLMAYSEEDLLRKRGIGKKTVAILKKWLASKGLHLRGGTPLSQKGAEAAAELFRKTRKFILEEIENELPEMKEYRKQLDITQKSAAIFNELVPLANKMGFSFDETLHACKSFMDQRGYGDNYRVYVFRMIKDIFICFLTARGNFQK